MAIKINGDDIGSFLKNVIIARLFFLFCGIQHTVS